MHRTRLILFALSLFALVPGTGQATLIDRGGGLIYDDVLNVTWMQDALYGRTAGVSANGRLNYSAAMAFADTTSYYDSVRDTFWNDWRLPTTVNSRDSVGYDLTGQSSELGHMYYINLGYAPNYAPNPSAPAPVSSSYNPFINLTYLAYWSETLGFREGQAWGFHFHFGFAGVTTQSDVTPVWLVRSGDVVAHSVPEPATLALLGASLISFSFVRPRRRPTQSA